MRISTVITTLVLSTLPAAPAAANRITPFDLLDDGSIVVPVTIGGTGPYRFVIDTGSSRTVITTRLWKSLRLPVVARTIMVTPAGRDEAYIVRLDEVAIGGQRSPGIAAAVMPAERYAAGQQVDGLIGQDVLATAIFTIDYRRRSVEWHAVGDVLPGARLPLEVRDNRVLVSLAQHEGDPNPLSLVPDTGSDALVLFPRAGAKLKMTPLEVGVLTGMAGTKLVHRVQLEGLRVGETRLENPLAVIVDSNEAADLMGDGLLPLHVFSRVTFNVAERYLIVAAR